MSVRVNVHMSKSMRTHIKLGVLTYATYANGRTLYVRTKGGGVHQNANLCEQGEVGGGGGGSCQCERSHTIFY